MLHVITFAVCERLCAIAPAYDSLCEVMRTAKINPAIWKGSRL
jgi:hypothetical protein